MKRLIQTLCLMLLITLPVLHAQGETTRWPAEQANAWYQHRDWPVGFNYVPRYAINQLEMWQADTFNPAVIDQELGWAAQIGFNMVRVFLHNLLWQEDSEAFSARIDQFLELAHKHDIAVMLVLFDDVWDPLPKTGKQRAPRPRVHNSGWLQAPGAAILGDLSRHGELESYVRGIVARYGQDARVAVWDLYNEPGNLNWLSYGGQELDDKLPYSLALLEKTFAWARAENPSQPLTSGVWRSSKGRWDGRDSDDPVAPLFEFMLQQSDVLSFHSYADARDTAALIDALGAEGRPLICTEYIARGHASTFESIMPLLVQKDVGALHWGFVSGKSQTIYPWVSWFWIARWWQGLSGEEPEPWHHDLLRADGTPYSQAEVDFIQNLIAQKHAR